MGTTECYYFTVPRSTRLQREWDSVVSRITGMNDSNQFLYLGSTEKRAQVSGIQKGAKAIAPAGGRRSWL